MSESKIRQATLKLYKAPFTYRHEIWDADNRMVADDPTQKMPHFVFAAGKE